MGVLPASIPQTLSPTMHPVRSLRIAKHAQRGIRPHVGRNWQAQLGIRTQTLPVCRSSFSPTSRQGARRVPRIRFRHRFNSHTPGRLARGGPSADSAVHMFWSAFHRRSGWIVRHPICAFFGEGVLDLESPRGIKGDYFPIPCFYDTGMDDHCASLSRCYISHRRKDHQGRTRQVSSRRICREELGGLCPIPGCLTNHPR